MARRRFTLLDVFTDRPLAGNGLAVVHGADGLDEATMLAFAREMRLSETSFVQSPTREGADYRNRIWTVREELAFAGHPSLGVAVAEAARRGETSAAYVQETPAGLQPLDVEPGPPGAAHASMLQEPARFGPEPDPAEVFATVGLTAGDAHPELPPQVVSTGVSHLMAPVRDVTVLARLEPDARRIDALVDSLGAVVIYLAAVDPDAGRVHARSFFHGGEDPATGSAAGPLCAYLAQRAGCERLDISQGEEMGRPSRISAAVEGDRVRVGGDVVVLVEGELVL